MRKRHDKDRESATMDIFDPDTETVEYIDEDIIEDQKNMLRMGARKRRTHLSETQRSEYGEQWAKTVTRFIGKTDIVAAYVSVGDEPPTHALLDSLLAKEVKILLPKLGPTLKREWAWYRGAEDLSVQAPGRPPEPSGRSLPSEVLADIQVLIIPALTVDRHGHRLGQGGGWYDRILKRVRPGTKVGAMVYPWEFVDEPLPQDDMDMRVTHVILPDSIEVCSPSNA